MLRQVLFGVSRPVRQMEVAGIRGFSLNAGGLYRKDDGCKKLDEEGKDGVTCRKPDLRRKKIPPYRYGYCREPDVPMLMACPPKAKRRGKGPCCHETSSKKGGCKVTK